jgi:predicted nucleic acid-binding protein
VPADEAAARIRDFAAWRVFAPAANDVLAAIDLHRQAKIGLRDAMIVLAATESGCDVLWTEDLTDGHVLRGGRNRNPFTERPD